MLGVWRYFNPVIVTFEISSLSLVILLEFMHFLLSSASVLKKRVALEYKLCHVVLVHCVVLALLDQCSLPMVKG